MRPLRVRYGEASIERKTRGVWRRISHYHSTESAVDAFMELVRRSRGVCVEDISENMITTTPCQNVQTRFSFDSSAHD